jgi:oligo-1,6-glucosidase/alpha-glucosidase
LAVAARVGQPRADDRDGDPDVSRDALVRLSESGWIARDVAPLANPTRDEQLLSERYNNVFTKLLNHTSDEHAWFRESASSRTSARRDWYIWRSMLGGSGWHHHRETDKWYWASFLPFQPDSNYRNPHVKQAMLDVVRHWLRQGVDGLRLDIFNAIYKDDSFADNPLSLRLIPSEDDPNGFFQEHRYTINHTDTFAFARELRAVVDELRHPERFLVGEVFGDSALLKRYCGDEADGLHLVFLLKAMRTAFDADSFYELIEEHERVFRDPLMPTYVFGNYGDEIGMKHLDIPFADAQDPVAARFRRVPSWLRPSLRRRGVLLNRDECRRPMQWHAGPHAGFAPASARPWLPVHPEGASSNVAAQGRVSSCVRSRGASAGPTCRQRS